MTYELAKLLKDAGFPQEPKIYQSLVYFDKKKKELLITPEMIEWHVWYKMLIKNPTLSELIEACGDKFGDVIRYYEDRWHSNDRENNHKNRGFGSTPEEAVANLWLKLNKK
jgi:hypothetical protein